MIRTTMLVLLIAVIVFSFGPSVPALIAGIIVGLYLGMRFHSHLMMVVVRVEGWLAKRNQKDSE